MERGTHLKVALIPKLIRWIFGYDQDARVIEPAVLRDAIAASADGIRANYPYQYWPNSPLRL